MKLPYYICLPRRLAFLPRTSARCSNEWLRATLIDAASAVSDRLGQVEQLRTNALILDAIVSELEWSWRRLDIPPPAHEDDEDLSSIVRATQDSVRSDLESCSRLLHQIRRQIAAMFGMTDHQLMQLRSCADKSTESLFRQPPAHKLSDPQIIALLAVACDCVNAPAGEHLGPVLESAFAQRLVRPGILPEPRKEDYFNPAKDLAKTGKDIKLSLKENDFYLVESIRNMMGLGKNQFAIHAITSRLLNEDPRTALIYGALRDVAVSVEALLHTGLACLVAARNGQLVGSREHKYLEEIAAAAKTLRVEAKITLQLIAGAGVAHCPAFLRAIKRLIDRAQRFATDASAKDNDAHVILRYLAALQILG